MKKVALVGTAPSGIHAPIHDLSWDIWGCGKRGDHITRVSRWYEVHRLDGEPPQWALEWRKLMREWAKDSEIWMFYPEQDLGPRIVQFDPKPLVDKYGTFFMTSTFSWMIAQAIEEGYQQIGLWGVDMEYGTEYRQQRVGLRHFIEIAKLSGIEVSRVLSSGISFEPVPYPMWQDDPIISKNQLRQKAIKERIENSKFTAEGMMKKIHHLVGQKDLLMELMGEPFDPPKLAARINKIDKDIESINAGMLNARDDWRKAEGSLEESKWLEDYLQP